MSKILATSTSDGIKVQEKILIGSQYPTKITGWSEDFPTRPENAPNLDLIDLTDFYGFYTTIDVTRARALCTELGLSSIAGLTGYNIPVSHSIYRGHLGNDGQFVSDEALFENVTGYHDITILATWPDYVIIKHDVGQGYMMNGATGACNRNYDLEIIGKSTTQAGRIANISIRTSAKRLKLIDFNNTYIYGNVDSSKSIQYLELAGFDWTAASSRQQINQFEANRASNIKITLKNQNFSTLVGQGFLLNSSTGLEELDLTGSHFPSLTNLAKCFMSSSIREIKNLESLFENCENITSTAQMFWEAPNLQRIIVHNKDFSSCTNVSYMFYRSCCRVIDFTGCKWPVATDWGNICGYSDQWNNTLYFRLGEVYSSFNIQYMTGLTHDNLVEILNDLGTVETAQTCTLGATNLAKLTDEEKQIATDKGWTLA